MAGLNLRELSTAFLQAHREVFNLETEPFTQVMVIIRLSPTACSYEVSWKNTPLKHFDSLEAMEEFEDRLERYGTLERIHPQSGTLVEL